MAGWREFALAVVAFWLPAGALMASNSVPADQAENAPPSPRAGWVQPRSPGVSVLPALQDAVRDDALRAWPAVQRQQLQLHTEAVTWADGSLGCPRPGQSATQALVPGWRLVVQGPGRDGPKAVYHASQRGQWLLCPGGAVPPAQPGPVTR